MKIENVTIQPYYNDDNVLRSYRITPNEGYLIHALDPESGAEDRTIPTFTLGTVSVGYNYDFDSVVADTFTYTDENNAVVNVPISKVGNLGIYAIPAHLVPTNEIYGGNDTSVEKALGEV